MRRDRSPMSQPVQIEPKFKMPWRPPSWGAKTRLLKSWFATIDLCSGQCTLGCGFDVAPTGFWVNLGPVIVGFEKPEPEKIDYDDLPNWSWTLYRFILPKWKLELRIECDLNIWQFGYSAADIHDHGLYIGPLNLQIEHNKLYNQPLGNEDPRNRVYRAFLKWRKSVRSRISIPIRMRGYMDEYVHFSFDGITSAIFVMLNSQEITVTVDWEGRNWDTIFNAEVNPRRSRLGYICEHCQPGSRRVFPTLEALWRDHLFEPFLSWLNYELAVSDVIGLCGSPSDGYTYAMLLTDQAVAAKTPDVCVPVRNR